MTIEPTKMNWWYESVIDWMLQNPDKNLTDCAREHKVTPMWIYTLTKAAAFKDALAQRRVQHNFLLSTGVIEKAEIVASMSLDLMVDKLNLAGEVLPFKTVAEVADSMLARLGYANNKGGSPLPTEVHVTVGVDPALLDAARTRLKQVQAQMEAPPPVENPVATYAGPTLELEASDDTTVY
jgi:hypothetical protein